MKRIICFFSFLLLGVSLMSSQSFADEIKEPTVNKAELYKLVTLASGYTESDATDCLSDTKKRNWQYMYFIDVPIKSWYAPYICLAKEEGFLKDNGKYLKPYKQVTWFNAVKVILYANFVDVNKRINPSDVEDAGIKYGILKAPFSAPHNNISRRYLEELLSRINPSEPNDVRNADLRSQTKEGEGKTTRQKKTLKQYTHHRGFGGGGSTYKPPAVITEPPVTEAVCGNDVVEPGEGCDDGNIITEVCDYDESCMVCNATCQPAEGAKSYCGDNITQPEFESCDGGENCSIFCTIINHYEPVCGDGIMEEDEMCDDGNIITEECEYGLITCNICNSSCQTISGDVDYCGDLNVNLSKESCDDGNEVIEDCNYGQTTCNVCYPDCSFGNGNTSYCGDRVVQLEYEECDGGSNCTDECTLINIVDPICGNGTVETGEVCDDSNLITEECEYGLTSCIACDAACQEVSGEISYCGDEIVEPDFEECDGGDDCSTECTWILQEVDEVYNSLANYLDDVEGKIIPRDTQEYIRPTFDQIGSFVNAFENFLQNGEDTDLLMFNDLGYKIVHLFDGDKDYWIFEEQELDSNGYYEKGWGTLIINLDSTHEDRWNYSVPHPKFESGTVDIARESFEFNNGNTLMIAGAHRYANVEHSDVAHTEQSIFHYLTEKLAESGGITFQIHGFNLDNYPDYPEMLEMIVSNGTLSMSSNGTRFEKNLRTNDFTAIQCGNSWSYLCATTNVQGELINSNSDYGDFIHLEIEHAIRSNSSKYETIAQSFDDIQTESNWIAGTGYTPDNETLIACQANPKCDASRDLVGIYFQTPLRTSYVNKFIMPYYTNMALASLMKADPKNNKNGVKEWMEWYINHINRTPDNIGVVGTIYDYHMISDTNTGAEMLITHMDYCQAYPDDCPARDQDLTTSNYDSSDSYAATFLSLVNTYYKQTGDRSFVTQNLSDLKLIATVMNATMHEYEGRDGEVHDLSWAKANYDVAYMMDNTEVWRGYYDFAELLDAIGDSNADAYYEKEETIRHAIEMVLWDEEKQGYKPHATGSLNWDKFYPDARANTRAITYDLPEAVARRDVLWNSFMAYHGNAWINLTAGDNPVMPVGPAGVKTGDINNVQQHFNNVREKVFPERKYPWTHTQSGFYIMSLLLMRDGWEPLDVEPILAVEQVVEPMSDPIVDPTVEQIEEPVAKMMVITPAVPNDVGNADLRSRTKRSKAKKPSLTVPKIVIPNVVVPKVITPTVPKITTPKKLTLPLKIVKPKIAAPIVGDAFMRPKRGKAKSPAKKIEPTKSFVQPVRKKRMVEAIPKPTIITPKKTMLKRVIDIPKIMLKSIPLQIRK